jgi:hypothetical protein
MLAFRLERALFRGEIRSGDAEVRVKRGGEQRLKETSVTVQGLPNRWQLNIGFHGLQRGGGAT